MAVMEQNWIRSLESIDWQQVCETISKYCGTAGGAHNALGLTPELSIEWVSRQVKLTQAIQALGVQAADLNLKICDEVPVILSEISTGVLAGPKQLFKLAQFLDLRYRVDLLAKTVVVDHPDLMIFLHQAYDRLVLLRQIQERISAHGEIFDDASPELRMLARQEDKDRTAVKKRLDDLIQKYGYQDMLMESYVTLRDGRYVLPVKIECHTQVKGVVHDVSNSRHTAFIEPFEIVKINNSLMHILEAKREACYKVLRYLTDRVLSEINFVRQDLEHIFELDLICAKVRFGQACGGVLIHPQGQAFALSGLRHPLLALQSETAVVANDITLDSKCCGLVISGPNMGGKTILLKSFGCAVVMSHCGIPIPCHRDSTIPFFSWLRFVIGDQQSLEQGISSFTFQIEMMKDLPLKGMGLILVDEIMSATDPQEGEALAQAFLMEWTQHPKVLIFVSTHYHQLKNLTVMGKIPMKFGAMAYEHGRPTYRFFQGGFGQSFGIDTAQASGVSKNIIQKARQLVGRQSVEINELARSLQSEVSHLHEQSQQLQKQQGEWETKLAEVTHRESQLGEEARKLEVSVTHQVWDEFEKVYREIKDQFAHLKQKPKAQDLTVLRDKTSDVITRIRGKLASLAGKRGPKMGEWYNVPHLGKVQVLDWREDKQYALVLCKNKKIRLSLEHFSRAKKV